MADFIYVYMHIYVYTYIHVHIYTNIHTISRLMNTKAAIETPK
jgi:hypothetical protein